MIALQASDGPLRALAFSPDGRWLAHGGDQCGLRVRDLTEGTERKPLGRNSRESCHSIVFTSANVLLAVGDCRILRWTLATDQIATMSTANHFMKVRLGPKERRLFCVAPSAPAPIAEFDVASSKQVREWPHLEGLRTGSAMDLSPDGKLLASCHYRLDEASMQRVSGQVVLRELKSGDEVHRLKGFANDPTALRFHPEGHQLAVLSKESLHLWDVSHAREIARHRPSATSITALAFTPDGRCLLTVGYDALVRCWNTTTWEVITTYHWNTGPLLDVALAPDGFRAAACDNAGKVVIWDVDL